jgi:RNA polymerase sigma factor (sigma-70 family)
VNEPTAAALAVEELAVRAATGDARALDELLVAVTPDVRRRCQRVLPNPLDAEEATQDALMSIARRITRFEGRSKFSTWCYQVSTNAAVDTYRRLKRHYAERDELPEQMTSDMRTSVTAGTRIDLLDALEQLDPRFAEAVVLRDLQGLDYSEIAATLNVPEGTVKSRIHEGRKTLKYLLER